MDRVYFASANNIRPNDPLLGTEPDGIVQLGEWRVVLDRNKRDKRELVYTLLYFAFICTASANDSVSLQLAGIQRRARTARTN